jgi:hypothetical protein
MPDMALPMQFFKKELLKRRVSLYESHARRVARTVFKQIRLQVSNGASPAIVTMQPMLEGLVKQYGCKRELIPYSVQCVKDLVAAKTLQ